MINNVYPSAISESIVAKLFDSPKAKLFTKKGLAFCDAGGNDLTESEDSDDFFYVIKSFQQLNDYFKNTNLVLSTTRYHYDLPQN